MNSHTPSYQLFMLALCLLALGAMAASALLPLDGEVKVVFERLDDLLCVVFFGDFLYSLWRAPNRMRYFFTWGWIDLLSSIPALDAGRWGRLARVARIFRLLRALRVASFIVRRRPQNTLLAALLFAILLITGSSVAILNFETLPQSNIKTGNDAMWWAITTMTTVGYGDHFPVSGGGRVVAALLMTSGVGLFGALSAALAAWFLRPQDAENDAQIAALRAEVRALREVLEKR